LEMNGMMHDLFDRCFFDTQLLRIRRLTDSYPLTGPKGVFSLRSLLKDMKKCSNLMTRESLFAVEGLEYDYEVVRKQEAEYFAQHGIAGSGALFIPNNLCPELVEKRHREIDALAGVDKSMRRPEDIINIRVFNYLITKIDTAVKDINMRVDKYIAHATTPESRTYNNAEETSLTLGHLWDTTKTICQVANFVDTYLLSRSSHSFLPTPQYNQFKYIDKPLISANNIEILSEKWHKFHKETDLWASWGLEEFCQEANLGSII